MQENRLLLEAVWSEAVAVGCKAFVEETQQSRGWRAKGRPCQSTIGGFQFKEDVG